MQRTLFWSWLIDLSLGLVAVGVVAFGHRVHGFEEAIVVDEGAYDDQTAQNVPEPEGVAAKIAADIAASDLNADAVRELVVPDQRVDSRGNNTQKNHNQIVHGILAVIRARNSINIVNEAEHDNDTVDAKSDER